MSDLAERIRAAVVRRSRNEESIASEGASGISHWPTTQERNELRVELADLLHDNAPTILAGLAAIEERDKLREAMSKLTYDVRLLATFPHDRGGEAVLESMHRKIAAALQPTPEQTKEQ